MVLEIAEEAQAEILSAGRWYRAVDQEAARAFETELRGAIQRIIEAPHRWPSHCHDTRRVLLHRFPYLVIYTVLNERIFVLALAHEHQRPGYWRKRSR